MKDILHCDLNNFFASVEELKNPDLKNYPIAVCGDPDLRAGIVLAKNMKAKSYGVVTAETIYSAKKKCKDLVIVKSSHDDYIYYSKKVKEIYLKDTNNYNEISRCIKHLLDDVVIELRDNNLKCECVCLHIKDNMFISQSKQKKITLTSVYSSILQEALNLLDEVYKENRLIRAVTVAVTNFTEDNNQISFLDDNKEKAADTVDNLRKKYGKNKIMYGSIIK